MRGTLKAAHTSRETITSNESTPGYSSDVAHGHNTAEITLDRSTGTLPFLLQRHTEHILQLIEDLRYELAGPNRDKERVLRFVPYCSIPELMY